MLFRSKTQLVPKATGFDSLVWVLPAAAAVCAAVGLFCAFRRWRANALVVPDAADRAMVDAALNETPPAPDVVMPNDTDSVDEP